MRTACIPIPKAASRPPETIYVNVMPQETRVAVMREGLLREIHIERPQDRSEVGNIYSGVVSRVVPGLQSAFVDVGLERTGFLHAQDARRDREDGGFRIERALAEGQRVLVQAVKNPIGEKGARLTARVSLAGRFLVYCPYDEGVGVSKRIDDETERERLRDLIQGLGVDGGFIARTAALGVGGDALGQEAQALRREWLAIREAFSSRSGVGLLRSEAALADRVIRDLYCDDTEAIWVDDERQWRRMRARARAIAPGAEKALRLRSDPSPMFREMGIERAIADALRKRVDLDFGGCLFIETTEAMTTIDVNTGKFTGGVDFEQTVFTANVEACRAIAREIAVRNLSGIIVVDFIDMGSEESERRLLEAFAEELKYDREYVELYGFTALGLVELSRKRERKSLGRIEMRPCCACGGLGAVESDETIACGALRRAVEEARMRQAGDRDATLIAAPEIVELLRGGEKESVAAIEKAEGMTLGLKPDASKRRGEFELRFG